MLPFYNRNLVGQVLQGQKGRYEIKEKIGHGGFGETYLAEDLDNNNQKCVIKCLKPNQHGQKLNKNDLRKIKELFQLEAKYLNTLNHPQIPKLKDYFVKNHTFPIGKQNFYLVEEYIEGKELTQELPFGKKLNNDEVWQVLHDILEILVFLHDQNLIHRDVKPANLIRRERDKKLVLFDFGTVKDMSDNQNNQSSIVIGTDPYMPMERKNRAGSFNTDVHAVGIIGIQALTGFSPNPGKQNDIIIGDNDQIVWRHLAPEVSSELADVIDKMVHPNWQQYRYNTAKDALKAIKAIAPITPVQRSATNQDVNVPDLIIGEHENNFQDFKPREIILFFQKNLTNFINKFLTLRQLNSISITTEPDSNNSHNITKQNLPSTRVLIIVGVATALVFAGIGFRIVSSFKKPQLETLGKIYVDSQKNMGFTIQYSEKWTAKSTPADEEEKVKFYRKDKSQKTNCPLEISVNVADLGKVISLEQYKIIAYKKIQHDPLNKLANANEQVALNNSEAYQIEYIRQEDGCTLKVLERGTMHFKKAYYITYQSLDKEYNQFWPVVEKMIDSFEIKEES